MRSHLREPITIPRWLLTIKYTLFVFVGVTVLWASSPSVDEVSPNWLTPVWAGGITLTATIALVGSLAERFEPLERWSCAVLASLFIVFAVAPISLVLQGDADRAVYSVIALGFACIPTFRTAQLLRRTGMTHG